MNHTTTTLPESAAIVGTKAHCSVLPAPLGNYFGEGCIIHLANIFATLSALLDWRIPPGRKVIAGFSQESGGLCQPPSSILRAIRPNINTDSILFDGGHLVESTDLVILFQYLTCEMGWVGMDLRPTEQAGQMENPTDRNEPAALFACLKPDMIRVDKIVAWALRLRDQVILDSGMNQVDDVCSSLFLSHLADVNHLRASGIYRRDGQVMSCTGPVTPVEFHNLRNGEFFHTRSSTPLPPPIIAMPPQEEIQLPQLPKSESKEVPRGTIGGEVVGEVMVFKTLDDFNSHIEGFSQSRFRGQLLVPKSLEEFDLRIERLRFIFIESEGFIGCHLYTLVPLYQDKKSFRPYQLLKTLKDIQSDSGVGQVVETNDIGNTTSAIFDINLLLRWASMAGRGISENNAKRVTHIVARMDDIKTVMNRPGAVTREWSTPECQCLKYFMNCGCDEVSESAETDTPVAGSELDRQEWLDEYIRHAKSRLLEVTNDIKARLNSELEAARNCMTGEIHEILSGLHKAIDPEGHSALYPSVDPDEDSGHEEG